MSDKLKQARDLIAAGWTQLSYDRIVDDKQCYCAAGAIIETYAPWMAKPSERDHVGCEIALRRLAKTLVPDLDGQDIAQGVIVNWNDTPGRTQDEVLAAFDKAIEEGAA
ncbi:MAG: hypothetical protein KDK08_05575 [Rhizobiaceae bacterium]|nr:hypothetical protein [Rhizobiaceae bacterium]MCC0000938.1 hypothetical protein [Methylobacteriaceae bacterium]